MQILRGIHRRIVNADFVVQVRAGTVSGRTNIAQDVTPANVLPCDDGKSRKMSVEGFHSVAMIDDYFASVPCAHSSLENHSIRRRAYRVALAGGNVDAGVKCAFTLEGIKPGAEGAGYDPLHRPLRWRVSHVDPAAQSHREAIR